MPVPLFYMKTRREFFKSAAVLGALGATGLPLRAAENKTASVAATPSGASGSDRDFWISVLEKIARPVLENLARRELKLKMPVEEQPGARRKDATHLEAFGRLLYGVAPWLAVENLSDGEKKLQMEFIKLTQIGRAHV